MNDIQNVFIFWLTQTIRLLLLSTLKILFEHKNTFFNTMQSQFETLQDSRMVA